MSFSGGGHDRRDFLKRALTGAVFTPPVIETLAAPVSLQAQLSPKKKGMMAGATGPLLMGTGPSGGLIPSPWVDVPSSSPTRSPRLRSSDPGED